ncbi:MAG: TrkA family potassium uptake protein [Fibrobacter sp.]|jgi:trk system potassium uptake protein TrkA|nr:TrkA family potassium uptake protein [Fibrobacter sp.]
MSVKQLVVIGIGNSGYFLARHLTALGHDVLAIDSNVETIQDINPLVSQAVVADTTRKNQLAALSLNKVDAVIVCIGDNLEASLLTILNLKELGIKNIIAKSSNSAHTTLLENMGVTDIFHPEHDMAISLAEKINRPNMLDYLPFMEGYSIIELTCPQKFIGKTLKELALTKTHGVQIIAIRDPLQKEPKIGDLADYLLQEFDVLFIIGPNKALDSIKD